MTRYFLVKDKSTEKCDKNQIDDLYKVFFVLENVEVDQLRLVPILLKLNPSFYIDASKSVLTHICMLLFV